MSDFYIQLPSSVKSQLYDNKISHYLTNFNTPISLIDDDYEYETAVTKVIYPANVKNVVHCFIEYYSFASLKHATVSIPNGKYSPLSFIKAFESALAADSPYYRLTFDVGRQLFSFLIQTNGYVKLTPNLQAFLGFPSPEIGADKTDGEPYDPTGGQGVAFIYLDAVELTPIGDTVAPLVCTLAMELGSNSQREYQPVIPQYCKLIKHYIPSIKIEVVSRMGSYIEFSGGEFLLVLHIRRRRPRL